MQKDKNYPEIALFEPDIPQNVGNIMRTCDCFGVKLHIIEPCGFLWNDKYLKRAGMDYLNTIDYKLHNDFQSFYDYVNKQHKKIVLATTKSSEIYTNFDFSSNDVILFGKESKGVPEDVHNVADSRIRIDMKQGKRSLNLSVSVGIVLSEALRQLKYENF